MFVDTGAWYALVRRLGIDTCLAIDSDFRAFGLHCLPPLD